MGTGAKREVHLPWLRLLLGEIKPQPALRDGEAADQPGEIPQQPQGDEGMDSESSLSETRRPAVGAAEEAAGVSELLRSHRQLADALDVLV